MTLTAPTHEHNVIHPHSQAAREDAPKAALRISITIILSGFLFFYCGAGVASTWLAVTLALECGSALARDRIATGDLRFRIVHIALPMAVSFCWVAHALLLWSRPEEIARITALMDFFSVALYGAIGAHKNRALLFALIAPPLCVLSALLFQLAWTSLPLWVALVASLATVGACATIALNGWALHVSDLRINEAALALARERDSLEARVRERTADLDAARRDAEAASAAKTQFMRAMTHELRTPLNAVIGYAEMIGEDLDAGAPVNPADAANIRTSGKRLMRMVNNVLDLTALETNSLRLSTAPSSITDIVRAAVAEAANAAAAANTRIETDIAPDLPIVDTDALRLKQCLAHLLDNACKFTRDGTVRVSAAMIAGKQIAIGVADTGPGLAPDKAARAFEAFMQASEGDTRSHDGAGLGLAITKRLMDLMGGGVTLQNTPGAGLTVTLLLPADPRR